MCDADKEAYRQLYHASIQRAIMDQVPAGGCAGQTSALWNTSVTLQMCFYVLHLCPHGCRKASEAVAAAEAQLAALERGLGDKRRRVHALRVAARAAAQPTAPPPRDRCAALGFRVSCSPPLRSASQRRQPASSDFGACQVQKGLLQLLLWRDRVWPQARCAWETLAEACSGVQRWHAG